MLVPRARGLAWGSFFLEDLSEVDRVEFYIGFASGG